MDTIQAFYPDYFDHSDALAYMSLKSCIGVLHDDYCHDVGNSGVLPQEIQFKDSLRYYIAINSWCAIVEDILDAKHAKMLAAMIRRDGLIDCIRSATDLAAHLVPLDSSWGVEGIVAPSWSRWQTILDESIDPIHVFQILRYLSRFSCEYRDALLTDDALTKFLQINEDHRDYRQRYVTATWVTKQHISAEKFRKRNAQKHTFLWAEEAKRIYRDGQATVIAAGCPQLSQYWKEEISIAMDDIFHGKSKGISLTSDQKGGDFVLHPWDETLGYFSSGAVAEGALNKAQKEILYLQGSQFYCGYRSPWYDGRERPTVSKILAVPKSWKTKRIIAEEFVVNAYRGQAINAALQAHIRSIHGKGYTRRYDPSDQDLNRSRAVAGAIDGCLSTIDMSGASDRIGKYWYSLVAPSDVQELVNRVSTDYILVQGKKRKNYILLTSGTGLTFDNESNCFEAIGLACERVYTRWTGEKVEPTTVIGDDMVVDTKIFPMVCEVLAECGFVVNPSKSYTDTSHYRESCGIECFGGYAFQGKYYPRSGIDFDNPTLAVVKLAELQHKFFYDYPVTASFFEGVVRDMCPRMTMSAPGTECTDLWGYNTSFNPVTLPPAEGEIPPEVVPYVQRQLHVVLSINSDRKSVV